MTDLTTNRYKQCIQVFFVWIKIVEKEEPTCRVTIAMPTASTNCPQKSPKGTSSCTKPQFV